MNISTTGEYRPEPRNSIARQTSGRPVVRIRAIRVCPRLGVKKPDQTQISPLQGPYLTPSNAF